MKKWWKVVIFVFAVYFLYAFGFGILSYAFPKTVTDETKNAFQYEDFFGTDATKGIDQVVLVEYPQDAFDKRIEVIEEAKETLDISYHTVAWGQSTEYFFSAIIAAADRGVKVRVLLDGKLGGLKEEAESVAFALLVHPNIEYKVYNPLNLLKPWTWNSVLHDKYIIADHKYLLLGGRNIGDRYFDSFDYNGEVTNDRDVLVKNTAFQKQEKKESVIYETIDYMNEIWNFKDTHTPYSKLVIGQRKRGESRLDSLREKYQNLKKIRPELFKNKIESLSFTPTNRIRLLHNPINTSKKEPTIAYHLQQIAYRSKESVIFQTPYTIPDKPMRESLIEIGKRVPTFELLTNSAGTSPNLPAFSYYYATRKNLNLDHLTIYEYQGNDSIHGKTYLFDGVLSAVGSLNFDERSVYIDTETMLVIDSPEFYQSLHTAISDYQKQSLIVGKDNTYLPNENVNETKVPFFKKLLLNILSIFTRIFHFLI